MHWRERHTVIPAVFLVFQDDDKVLLIRRRGSYADGWYSLPAGHPDGNEPASLAASREGKEEVGVDIDTSNLNLVHTMHEKADEHERINLFFTVQVYGGELQNMEPEKCYELCWIAPDKLPPKTVPQVRLFFEKFLVREPYSEFNFDPATEEQYGPLPPPQKL